MRAMKYDEQYGSMEEGVVKERTFCEKGQVGRCRERGVCKRNLL